MLIHHGQCLWARFDPIQQQSFVLCVGLKPLNKTLSSLFLQYPLAQVHSMGGNHLSQLIIHQKTLPNPLAKVHNTSYWGELFVVTTQYQSLLRKERERKQQSRLGTMSPNSNTHMVQQKCLEKGEEKTKLERSSWCLGEGGLVQGFRVEGDLGKLWKS